ncbi:MAG: cytochrome ubiquinol oxidase subunit I, partial [Pseudomonadota bacterium]
VPGLNDFVAEDGTVLHPPVAPVFWSFRIMVGTGMLMLLISWVSVYLIWRRGIDGLPSWLLVGLVAMSFSGWLATLAGWYTTEIGRQPWLVQGVLSTADAVGDVPAGMVLSTLIAYLAIYAALTATYIGVVFYLARRAALGQPPRGEIRLGGAAPRPVPAG